MATARTSKEEYWGHESSGPRSCYDESKRCRAITMVYVGASLWTPDHSHIQHIRPHSDLKTVASCPTLSPRLAGKPITVYGDGSQTRSLCFVDDLVEGIAAMFTRGTTGEVINLGNPQEHTVLQYAHIVRRLCNSNSQIQFLELPQDDPTRRCPDISKARSLLGWEPRIGLEEGLKRTIEWFKELAKENPK